MKLIDALVANQFDLISQFDQLVEDLLHVQQMPKYKLFSTENFNGLYLLYKGRCEGALKLLNGILSYAEYEQCHCKFVDAVIEICHRINNDKNKLKAFEYFNQLFALYQSINDIPTPKLEQFRQNQLPQLSDLEFQTLFDEWKDQLNVEPVES